MAADLPPGERPRCTATSVTTGEQCKRRPHPGSNTCVKHGSGAPQVRAAAARRVREGKALTLAKRSAAGLDLSAYSDPVTALEHAIGHTHVLALRLAGIAGQIPDDQVAYHTKSGSYLRGEITGTLKALDSLRAASEAALRIGLDARRAGITESTVDMLDRALEMALNASGIGLDGRAKARETFRRHIRVVADGG